jgi:hypothetical protein
MYEVIAFLILIPMVIMAIRFWIKAAQWGIENKRSFGKRVQRVRSAFDDSGEE